ncbi:MULTISPECIES: chlororespiratory reduction protein 7 [Trichocoleus]|uniref:Chlororespiratory reduction protein 7 n=1 Tax=Trichocoleus desertorum GB2-A4 TaxID=2933944 RepID=A0ABV0J1G4_9CYAN|nr:MULTISPECIES: chlororespiratory reduction protein 7 [unclassified Trichocoleus]MBD1860227.1 chlororespiratory reduction protein 7 [Trichocoleus sp. FACHB-46]MBD2097784.1 chlororespiratory reduction protein 7 [Trichocoleus sp. FACHB-591]MBD2120042.1 chlororespiratory reduction protein 7 [Trichocoleus sp. FACHB-262]
MPDPLMYRQDHFVVLAANQPEQFLTAAELLSKLEAILAQRQDSLPQDLQKLSSIPDQAQYLLDTSCELDMGPGDFLQWYVVRLEK